jgi:hypothetical protein
MENKNFIVIERYSYETLLYWHPDGFTPDIHKAIKFADRDSADQVLSRLCESNGRSVVHRWMELVL